jgi:ribonuclease HI
MSKKKTKQYYAVVQGHKPGIYNEWFGPNGAAEQVQGFPEAIYKGFYTEEEMREWLSQYSNTDFVQDRFGDIIDQPISMPINDLDEFLEQGNIVMYSDGAALNNPGPGGYGVVLLHKKRRKELSEGFRLTTNNRMELLGCIAGLKELKFRCSVVVVTDSRYVVDGITKGWAKGWRSKNWMRTRKEKAENSDLWAQLLDLCDQHEVQFRWVKGHAGNVENERCDQLAMAVAQQQNLPPDSAYESRKSTTQPTLLNPEEQL